MHITHGGIVLNISEERVTLSFTREWLESHAALPEGGVAQELLTAVKRMSTRFTPSECAAIEELFEQAAREFGEQNSFLRVAEIGSGSGL